NRELRRPEARGGQLRRCAARAEKRLRLAIALNGRDGHGGRGRGVAEAAEGECAVEVVLREVREVYAAQASAELHGVEPVRPRRRVRHLPARRFVERIADGRAAGDEGFEDLRGDARVEGGLFVAVAYELEARLVDGRLVEDGRLRQLQLVRVCGNVVGALGQRELRDALIAKLVAEVAVA